MQFHILLKWLLAICFLLINVTFAFSQTELLGQEEDAPPPEQPLPQAAPAEQPPPQAPQPQQARVATINTDVILLMDVSGSMEAFVLGQKMNKLESAKTALVDVVKKMNGNTRIQLWTFSAAVTQHPSSLKKKGSTRRGVFESVEAQGSAMRSELTRTIQSISIPSEGSQITNLYAAILQAMQYFYSHAYEGSRGQSPEKIVVVLADGQDENRSSVKLGSIMIAKGQFPDIQIRTIGFGIQEKDPFHQVLCGLSTKNQCAIAQNTEQLKKVISSFTN